MRGCSSKGDPRFTFHASRFTVFEAGRERRRWPRIVRRSRKVNFGQGSSRLRKSSVYTQYAVGIVLIVLLPE